LINIKPRFYGKYDCYQNNVIGPVSEYWHIDYFPVFWTEFNFINETTKIPNTFEELVFGVGNRFDRGKIWNEVCGVSLTLCHYDHFEIFKKVIINEFNKGNPTVIAMNSNDVPWNRYYQIRPHCFLACGIDDKNREIVCSDGTFNPKGYCKINIEYLYDKYQTIILLGYNKEPEKTWREQLAYFLDVFQDNNPQKVNDINRFAEYILLCWEKDDIFTVSKNISYSYFLLYLTEVCNSRHNFTKGLEYFERKYKTHLFQSTIEELIDVRSNWDAFKGLYIKSVLSKNKAYIIKAINLLYSINEKEKKITDKIILYCKEELKF